MEIKKRNRQRNNIKIKTKLIGLVFSFMVLVSSAQTEITGVLDDNPSNGIGGALVQVSFQNAVWLCRNLVHDGKTDWYLPTIEELWLFCPATKITGDGANLTAPVPGCSGSNCDIYIARAVWTRSLEINAIRDNQIMYMCVNLLGDFGIHGYTDDQAGFYMKSLGNLNNANDHAHGYAEGSAAATAYVRCVR